MFKYLLPENKTLQEYWPININLQVIGSTPSKLRDLRGDIPHQTRDGLCSVHQIRSDVLHQDSTTII
jgi:hypothetical protein